MSRCDPLIHVHHMLDHAREAVEMVRYRTRADLDTDRMLNLALVRLMEVVGEAAAQIPEEFRLGSTTRGQAGSQRHVAGRRAPQGVINATLLDSLHERG